MNRKSKVAKARTTAGALATAAHNAEDHAFYAGSGYEDFFTVLRANALEAKQRAEALIAVCDTEETP